MTGECRVEGSSFVLSTAKRHLNQPLCQLPPLPVCILPWPAMHASLWLHTAKRSRLIGRASLCLPPMSWVRTQDGQQAASTPPISA
ncbi:hypothetical protein RJ55_02588 [Drechmeria coniospora]|nr:hypothetical protein RJ55_02588 [Drechmeria coniospora]